MEYANKAATILAPGNNKIRVLAVTTSSQEQDISTPANSYPRWEDGNYLTLVAEQNTWINFGTTTGGSVNEATTGIGTGGTQGWYLAAGVPQSFIVREDRKYLYFKGAAAGYLRLYVSSANPTEYQA